MCGGKFCQTCSYFFKAICRTHHVQLSTKLSYFVSQTKKRPERGQHISVSSLENWITMRGSKLCS